MRPVRALATFSALLLSVCLVALGGAGTADAAAPPGERTFYTGIDPGAGDYYSYAPSAIETSPV